MGEVDTAGEVQVGGGVKEVIHPVQVNPAIVISGLRQLLTYMWNNSRRVLVQMSPFRHAFLIFSSLFFTVSLIDLIVKQTNLYASQVMDASHYHQQWSKVTADEIWAY